MREEMLDRRQEGLLRSVEEDVLTLLFANPQKSTNATSTGSNSSTDTDVHIWRRVYIFLLRAGTLAYNILLLSVFNVPIVLPAVVVVTSEGSVRGQGLGDDAAAQLELMVKTLRELLRQSALEFSLCVVLSILVSCLCAAFTVAFLLIMACTSKERALPQPQPLHSPYRR